MKTFFRKTIFPKYHLDSIQAILEMHEYYGSPSGSYQCFQITEKEDPHSSLSHILRLDKEGFIQTTWDNERFKEKNLIELKSIALTIEGYKLLEELKSKSKAGKLGKRVSDLVWVIFTSIITTLAVLWIKSC